MAIPDIVTALRAQVAATIGNRPATANSASEIGAACERYLVYRRVAADQAELPTVELAEIFAEGHLHERAVIAAMIDAGINVIEQQSTIHVDAKANIVGHVDGIIVGSDGARIPFDVKSMSEHIWRSVAANGAGVYTWDAVAEAFRAKSWLRKYCAQLQLYMYGVGVHDGLLVCKNKATGSIAQVNMTLDLDMCGDLVERGERIEAHIKSGTLPARIEWDEVECPRCPFVRICMPERVDTPPERWIPEPRIAEACEVREQTDESRRRYEEADALVKSWAKAQEVDAVVVRNGGDCGWKVTRTKTRAGTRVVIERVT